MGRPLHGEAPLFERISLEAFQSGCRGSPSCASAKRSGGLCDFDRLRWRPSTTATVARLLADAGIVRNRLKVLATIASAGAVVALDGGLDALLWSFSPGGDGGTGDHRRRRGGHSESTAMAKA